MTIQELQKIHRLIIDDKWADAANEALRLIGRKPSARGKRDALPILRKLFQSLLDKEMYLHAATLQWGSNIFNVEPESTVRVFKALHDGSLILLMGSSSMSKTYAAGAYFLLDYLRDPWFTTVKLAAINEDHLKKNLFAHVAFLFRNCAIPPNDEIEVMDAALWMGVKKAGYEFGISGLAFKQSQETSGQFKGYKAKPVNRTSSSKLGTLSRLRVLGDECLPYDQEIMMADGSRKKIGYIVDNKLDGHVLSVNNTTGIVEQKRIVAWRKVPRRGRKIVSINGALMTEDHPVLTRYGYISALQAASYGLHVYVNEDISKEPAIDGVPIIGTSWKPAWRLINLSEFRNSWERESKVRTWCVPARLSSVEEGSVHEFQPVGDKGTIQDGMGGRHVSLFDMFTSSVHKRIQDACDRRQEEAIEGSMQHDKSSSSSSLVHGRRRNISERSERYFSDIDVCISSRGRYESSGEDERYGNMRSASPYEERTNNCNGHKGNKGSFLDDRAVHTRESEIQDSWTALPGEAFRNSHDERAYHGELLHLREAIRQDSEGKDMLEGMQFYIDKTSWDEGAQEDESVYCIDVEDNHNFFAGNVCVKNCQNWPGGPFQDFNSLKASMTGTTLVKIACAFNPESVGQHVVQMAEPEDGWNVSQLDSLYDYESKAGWRVCRLDAALCENVKQKKVIYQGLQTYEGFMSYLKAGGDSSPSYMTFARGMPPLKGTTNSIIPPTWPSEARGEATFIETPITVVSVDLAFMGADTAQMAVGRWGLASGYRPQVPIIGAGGVPSTFIAFNDRTNIRESRPRHVLQIDQLIPLAKHDDTIKMAQEIISRCKQLGVKPEHTCVDRTGIGQGTYDHLKATWGDVVGVLWSEGATDMKILAEDTDMASKQCDGIMSEMWWAFRRWIDPTVKAILINPIIPPQPLHSQMTSRQYSTGKKGIKVESKESYKSRNQRSPDEADSVIQLCFLVRKITDTLPGMVERKKSEFGSRRDEETPVTTPAKQASTEESDSICADGEENERLISDEIPA